MKRYKFLLIGIGAIIVVVLSYFVYISYFQNNSQTIVRHSQQPSGTKKSLEDINKFLHEKNKERIESFVSRRGWDMSTTKSGLWYHIDEKGEGRKIQYGDFVKMDYEIRLLDGTLLYSSESDGHKIIQVGKDKEVKGLHEGLELLSEGDIARFIIPPNLAYGLVGDGERIPAKAILYYKIEILKVAQDKIES
ncbi:MAG: FKBP-type peptidyl-prolyl cis-trans isomerase [Bacteroidales bacterium]